MLDEFGTELESTESRLDTTMKKMAKVLRISNGEYLIIYQNKVLEGLVSVGFALAFYYIYQLQCCTLTSIPPIESIKKYSKLVS